MTCWQVDCYRRPLQDDAGQPLWELVVCTSSSPEVLLSAFCPQAEVTVDWLQEQLQNEIASTNKSPTHLQVFRPAALSLIEAAGQNLDLPVEATRRTLALKAALQQRTRQYPQLRGYTQEPYDPLAIERPPPQPLPEMLLGEQWRFGTLAVSDLERLQQQPIPIQEYPQDLLDCQRRLGAVSVPGLVIDGGQQSMRLARWLQERKPVFLTAQATGVVLEVGLCDRIVLFTYDGQEMATAAQRFAQRQQESQGLHFLLVQPDDTGVTFTGLWLLQ